MTLEIACIGCRNSVKKQEALKSKSMSIEQYCLWLVDHEKSCQAGEYSNINFVELESNLPPVVFIKSLNQKLFIPQ